MRVFTAALIGTLFVASSTHGQEGASPVTSRKEPQTKIEAMEGKKGVVLIKGYSESGQLTVESGVVEVECREFTDASAGQKLKGIQVSIRNGEGRSTRHGVSAVDYDEVDGLIKAIESISRIEKGVTAHTSFEASYRTKGNLVVATFNLPDGEIKASIDAGGSDPQTAFIEKKQLTEFKNLLLKAKALLDDKK